MEFKYVIPTHGRPEKQLTLRNLPQEIREQTIIVTSTKEDAKAIRENYNHSNIVVAKNTTGIANKRHWIMNNIKGDHIFFMDDDLDFYVRCRPKYRSAVDGQLKLNSDAPPGTYLLGKPKSPKDVSFILGQWLPKMAAKYPITGLSSRMGNNHVVDTYVTNSRIMHAFGVDVGKYKFIKANFGAVKYREDFHVALEFLKRGLPNIVYYDVCCAPAAYGAPGGTSLERTVAASDEEAIKLGEMHHPFVKVLDKDYKGTPRKEVMVYWKKAFAYGEKQNGN